MAAAISDREERDNFFRLTLLLFRVGNQRLREFFKSQWPTVYQNAKGAPPPVVPWSDTPNDATEMNKIETKLKLQNNQKKLFNSGNTNNWDFSLLTTVLINSSLKFVTAASPECNAIKDMKEIRNKLIGHAPDARIPSTVFGTEWPKACQALKHFNATQGEFDGVMEDVKKPIDSLVPILKECLTLENEILDAIDKWEAKNELRHKVVLETVKDVKESINEGEAKNELRHKEVIETIKKESEDTKKLITDEVKQVNKEYNEPKASGSKPLKMKETERALIQQRLKHFKNDVIATELLDYLPHLTQEQKDEITYNEKNYTTVKALGTLVEKLEEFEDGFKMLVRALLRAGLGHVAVLLDANCTDYDEPSTDDEDIHSYVSIDGTAFVIDIRIPLRVLVADQREFKLEERIALKFKSNSSPDSKKLRKEFNKVLPKEVHFVHTTQLGGRTNQNTRSEDTATDEAAADNPAKTMDSVVLVFRVAKVPALDMLWDSYKNGDLKKHIREVIIPSNGGADWKSVELEMVFQEKDYKEIRTFLGKGEAEIDEDCRPSTGGGEDETMETSGDTYLPKQTTRIRKVYLEDNYHKEIQLRDYQKELAAPALGGQNTVICAPTNSGKTFVAMEIAKRHLDSACNDSRKAKVIFVVNKQNLVFQQRARTVKCPNKETDRVSLLCQRCSELICYAHNIRTFYTHHYVVIGKDIYERINVLPHRKPYRIDEISVSEKVYCKKCDFDLGVVFIIKGKKWPCIKIRSFKVQFNVCKPTLYKKWKDFPYSIIEVESVEELRAAQKDTEA